MPPSGGERDIISQAFGSVKDTWENVFLVKRGYVLLLRRESTHDSWSLSRSSVRIQNSQPCSCFIDYCVKGYGSLHKPGEGAFCQEQQ
ncbi:hypothetical protein TNCV_1821371 [Trichonephila clavipes]|nr:hypothetical protein TNCV_1821371 [Trichonephila clavipes]